MLCPGGTRINMTSRNVLKDVFQGACFERIPVVFLSYITIDNSANNLNPPQASRILVDLNPLTYEMTASRLHERSCLLESSLLLNKEGTHSYFDVLVNYQFFQLILIFYQAQ